MVKVIENTHGILLLKKVIKLLPTTQIVMLQRIAKMHRRRRKGQGNGLQENNINNMKFHEEIDQFIEQFKGQIIVNIFNTF